MNAERVSGTLAAAVTPLRKGGRRLDEDAFGPLLEFYAAAGLDGLLVLGTTGEGILLSAEERKRAAELAVVGAGGLKTIVHCGAQTTAETAVLAAHAGSAGADGFGAGVIRPMAQKMTPQTMRTRPPPTPRTPTAPLFRCSPKT